MQWEDYKQFDSDYGFSAKAGFQLSDRQVELVHECLKWKKLLNKAEVGCGKTVLSTVVSLMHGYDVTVVTVPPILVTPWVTWLNQVSDRVVMFRGTPKYRRTLDLRSARWIVCSHAIYRDDFNFLEDAVKGKKHEVIVDEAHAIKNVKSVLYNRVSRMAAGDVGCQMLTGTPVSKPLDGYTYIKIKTPQVYRSAAHFEAVHVAERDFFKNPTKFSNLDLLKQNLEMQSVSATKEAMHGYSLKPLTPDCHYDLDPKHLRLYEKLVNEQLLSFDDGTVIDATTVQRLQHAMQQIVVNWDYFSQDEGNRAAAYDLLDLTIEETECSKRDKSKLIVWTKYKRTSRSVLEYCKSLGLKSVAAYSEADSEKSVQEFMNDPDTRVLVAQPQSAGAGLNPQHVCWEMLFLEIDTVPIYARQAWGRIDRMGQKHTPRIKVGVARGTVQERLYRQLLSNDDLVQAIEPSKKSIRDMLLGAV